MKIHSSLDFNISVMVQDLIKHGIALVDDLGTPDMEQLADIEEAVLFDLENRSTLFDIEVDQFETYLGSVFVMQIEGRV